MIEGMNSILGRDKNHLHMGEDNSNTMGMGFAQRDFGNQGKVYCVAKRFHCLEG